MWEWEKWRGECANGMDERCEANLLIASVRPAVGRAVFIIREHAIFFFWKKAISFPSYTISSTPWAFPFCAGPPPMGVVWIVFLLLRSPWPFLSSLLTR